MTDYIKREDAIDAVCGDCPYNCSEAPKEKHPCMEYKELMKIPSADVAPVVRCKDCKHWDEHSQYGYDYENGVYGNYCMLWTPEDDFYAVETPADGFCFEAKRRDDE